jgi:hypothetical protein
MLIECADCGREVSDQAVACPQCGRPVASVTGTAPPVVVIPPKIETERTNRRHKEEMVSSTWLGVLGGGLFVVACVMGFNLVMILISAVIMCVALIRFNAARYDAWMDNG